jgi:hypothetical protein
MQRKSRSIIILVLVAALFSACNRTPDHMRYIPKDAVVVAGINIKSLGKKIAWNAITGSKLFHEMEQRLPEKNAKDAISGIEKAGIDVMNTFYVYIKTDNRFSGGNRITGLIPLSDAGAWEAYVKRVFPNAQITQHGDRKEASLGTDMYVGWNKNLLIIINMMQIAGMPGDSTGQVNVSSAMGNTDVSAEMENAFTVTKENSIAGVKNFKLLQDKGHDVTFWLNYDQLMTQYSGNMAQRVGVSLSGALWKDAAFAAGFDFQKGKIAGDMRYYVSEDLKEVAKELGATNISKDMVDRLPHDNLDALFAMHLSPKGLKGILEKTGLLGLANVGLSGGGLTIDNILQAFTGDMAFVMNDFTLKAEPVKDSFMGQQVIHKNQKATFTMCYVLKIDNKEQFGKLMQLAKENGIQQTSAGNGFVFPIGTTDTVYLLTNNDYLIASNRYASANGFLQGQFKGQKMPEGVPAVVAHPFALHLDIKQMFANVDAGIGGSPKDSTMIMESKKLLNNFELSGGEYKDNGFDYHMDVNFINTDENSIIQLMDYGMKMSDSEHNN